MTLAEFGDRLHALIDAYVPASDKRAVTATVDAMLADIELPTPAVQPDASDATAPKTTEPEASEQ